MNKTQPILGFFLTVSAILMWATLPIVLQTLLDEMNTQTIVWYRFLAATVGVFFILFFTGKLPRPKQFKRAEIGYLALGVFGLAGNFFLFNYALNYIPPTASQVISPLTSFFMVLAGVVIFKEKMRLNQKIGLTLLLIGLPLFFNNRLDAFKSFDVYAYGILIATLASFVWVLYGIAQKILLKSFNSQQILLIFYFICGLIYTPFAEPSQIYHLTTPFAIVAFVYCCINTVIAYGCYAEALNRWEVSKVSMMMPLIPISTIICAHLFAIIIPDRFNTPDLNAISYLGAGFVVVGSLVAAINKPNKSKKNTRLTNKSI